MPNFHSWPPLPLAEWQDTCQTLHMWTQIVGKIRMGLTPPLNHWWHATLYVTARGLTTSPIPHRDGAFEIQFDFLEHRLLIDTCEGRSAALPLRAEAVAVFYGRVMEVLRGLDIDVSINTKPQEVPDPILFERDYRHCSYDPEYVGRYFRILVSTEKVLQEFRSGYVGKTSPVQFFWGAMDLACVRFSGRSAVPPRKGRITGNTHEEVAVGFWPGAGLGAPAYYAYAAPHPAGLETDAVQPSNAAWNAQLGEFILLYDDVRKAQDPPAAVRAFCHSVYEAAAKRAGWDRAALELA